MSVFSSQEIEVAGKRAIQLTHKINEFDRSPRLITLIAQQEFPGYTRFPAAFEYLEEPDTQRFWKINSTLRIVAAPGVSALLQNFPDVYPDAEGKVPLLEIYRVQDPAVVPPMGTSISSYGLIGTEEINPPIFSFPANLMLRATQYPDNYFRIERRPSQIIISHPFSTTVLTMHVKQFSRTSGSTDDAKDRFCYQFDPQGILGSDEKPLLKIVKTASVSLEFSGGSWLKLNPSAVDPRQQLVFWKVYEVDDINAVPPQGYDIVPEPGWREITRFDRNPTPEETVALAAFDTLIGLIPWVGNFIDIAEFIYGLVTSKDRWGRKLEVSDKVIMGIGALLALVPHAVSSAENLVKLFGRRARNAETLIEALRNASLTAEEANLIRAMEDVIRKGGRPTAEMLERFTKIIRRVRGEYPSIESFLNADRSGFIHPQLQEAYQGYLQKQKRAGKQAANPREWTIRQTTGSSRQLLERLLGPDYARGTRRVPAERFFNLGDIPRPLGYTDAKLEAHLKAALRKRDKLVERLGKLLEQRRSGNVITRFLARNRVGIGYFSILKGNLGEIFSLEIQLQILQKRLIAEPSARLISGIRIKLMTEEGKLARSVLFTDNIVAARRGDNLHILDVFEVKAGYEGGQEATSQIFDWIEGRITDGSEVVIPKGARIINAQGIDEVVEKELTFAYKPDRRGVPAVTNLQIADRHIITARGLSLLGIDSSEQVAAKATRHALDMSSAELDYLVGRILSGSGLE